MKNRYFELLAHVVGLTDPREDRGHNHRLLDVIGLALCKTLCGSDDRSAAQQALHIVNAWANQVKFCLGQVSIESPSNEIPAVRELLEILNLQGAAVTADAMHSQQETAQKIINKQAGYVLPVKDNQPQLVETITAEL